MSRLRCKWLKSAAMGVSALLVSLGSYLYGIQLAGNFTEVVPAQLYRSAQPTASRLEAYTATYGIKSVLNLRGADRKAEWYREETAAAAKLGLHHVDFKMSADRELSSGRLVELRRLLRDLPRPILVHCKAGADRTGLVSAIFIHDVLEMSPDEAGWQISLRFGHIGLPYVSETFAMDRSWAKFRKTRAREG